MDDVAEQEGPLVAGRVSSPNVSSRSASGESFFTEPASGFGPATKWSQSAAWQRNVARGKTTVPFCVAHPTWSKWRWVKRTSVTSSGATPAAARLSGNRPPW